MQTETMRKPICWLLLGFRAIYFERCVEGTLRERRYEKFGSIKMVEEAICRLLCGQSNNPIAHCQPGRNIHSKNALLRRRDIIGSHASVCPKIPFRVVSMIWAWAKLGINHPKRISMQQNFISQLEHFNNVEEIKTRNLTEL